MSKIKKQINEEDIVVKLKSIKGIKPGIYLSVIYAIVITAVIFLILVFPGLKNPGTLIRFKTAPEKSVVYVDGVYRGTTPCSVFISKGDHEIVLEKDFFETIVINRTIKGRMLFSVILPRKENIVREMKLTDPEGFLKKRYQEIGGYALIRDYFEGYQYPHLIKQTVGEFLEGKTEGREELLYDFLYSMRIQLGNPWIVDDLADAVKVLNPETGDKDSDYSVIKTFYQSRGYNVENLVLGYLNAFPEKDRESVISGDHEVSNDYNSVIKNIPEGKLLSDNLRENQISVYGLVFNYVPSGEYTAGNWDYDGAKVLNSDRVLSNFPHRERIDAFYIMPGEVTVKQFSRFINENPKWSFASKEKLMAKRLVNGEYLSEMKSSEDDIPASYVSWYAAEAFCNWMTEKLPSEYKEFEIRLPTEAEWEWAARLNYSKDSIKVFNRKDSAGPVPAVFMRQGRIQLMDLLGNLWEWTGNYYFPTDTVFGKYGNTDSDFPGNEIAVRGGSWANNKDEISVSTRGSQPPSWCTPFLGFRTVLAKKEK